MNALLLLPTLPAALSILTAFGALLLTGIVGARLFARPLAIPDLTAWVLAGMLIGLPGLKLIAPEILTDLGNVLAWLVFGLLYTWAYAGQTDWQALVWPIGRFIVALLLGFAGGWRRWCCSASARPAGAASRHYDRDFALNEPDLLPFGRLLYIALFVHTGTMLSLDTFAVAWLPTLLLAARTASLTATTTLLAPKNGLSWCQGACTGLALSPIAWATLVWVGEIGQIEPAAAAPLAAIALAVQIVSALLGPIVTRFALQRCGESARYMGVSLPN